MQLRWGWNRSSLGWLWHCRASNGGNRQETEGHEDSGRDLGDPRGYKPSLTPPWGNDASRRKPFTLAALKWAGGAVGTALLNFGHWP